MLAGVKVVLKIDHDHHSTRTCTSHCFGSVSCPKVLCFSDMEPCHLPAVTRGTCRANTLASHTPWKRQSEILETVGVLRYRR